MAGIATGRGTDFSGVARRAQIIAIQVFSQCGEDCINSADSHWIQGLERVLELSASFDIAAVNLSLGRVVSETEHCDTEFPAVKEAMDNLRAAGIATVAASGNAGSTTLIDFPACISSAVSVGSTDDGSGETTPDAVSDFSNSSPLLDLLAPGRSITTSTLGDEFSPYRGTSLAVPHVTGAWAVLKSKTPHASVADLLSVLKATGIPIADPRNDLVKPRIQLDAALDRIVEELPYSSGTLLTLTARPNPGFRFRSWQGCGSPSGNRCVVDMNSVQNITAFFEPMADNYPDLVTTSLMGPSTAAIGSTASISADIRNQGPANAGPFRLGLYLSADTTVTTDDTWFAACSYESTLTNRGTQEAQLQYIYQAHRGAGSGVASDVIPPGQQQIEPDAFKYLRRLDVPISEIGYRLGTLGIKVSGSSQLGVLVRTTTAVPEGRAGLAYPAIDSHGGFQEPVYLCGLRQNSRDRSNVAFQNMGASGDDPITLRTTVFSGDAPDSSPRVLGNVTLEPGEFHQYSGLLRVLGSVDGNRNGYVKVERIDGTAPFYAYGVINDQTNSDGSFVFPVSAGSLAGSLRQTLPVIVETDEFTSELTVTNFSGDTKTIQFSFVADGLSTPDHTARFNLTLAAGQQRIIPDVIDTEMRRKSVEGVGAARGGLAGALFARVNSGDMSGIVIGARTSTPDGGGGHYGVFYNAVPDGAAFTGSAWVDALQQNKENRSNLALVNTGEVDDTESVFNLDIYDGDTGGLVTTITRTVPARRWHQINAILADNASGTTQGYVRIRQTSGTNPFLAYGVVNDGGSPGQRSGDGAYVPARE